MRQERLIQNQLQILHLEDDIADAELIQERLSREQLNARITRVATSSDFTEKLDQQHFDLILADYRLRSFDGFKALELAKTRASAIPFIFVSGTLGEEIAVESLLKGATDYILKHQLIRLVPAIRRALREVKDRQIREQATEALRRSQQEFSDFFEHAPMGFHWTGPDGRILKVNQAELSMFGYGQEEYVGHHMAEFHINKELAESGFARLLNGESIIDWEAQIRCKDGSIKSVLITSNGLWEHGRFVHSRTYTRDITSHKRAEMHSAAFLKLGGYLSSASTPVEAARNIANIADELFNWDAFTLNLYFAESDTVQPLLSVDTRQGRKIEMPQDGISRSPNATTRRIISSGPELVLRNSPSAMPEESAPPGEVAPFSASIMRVSISYRQKVIGTLAIHSYRVKAYDRSDLNTLHAFADYCGGALERIRAEEKLVALNTQVLNAARRAGMEEVANSVLHNVGNVLNSVNVSTSLMAETLSKSKLAGLEKISALIKDRTDAQPALPLDEAQSRQIFEYIDVLAKCWAHERAVLLRESQSLGKNIHHIKDIISRQQSMTGTSGFVEPVFITEMVEDALTVFLFDFKRIGALVSREYLTHCQVIVDKLKLMLVLVNLIGNARDALAESKTAEKQLALRTEMNESSVKIAVIDNGVGIAPENLTRIFSHGFTTKADGHGFGLHGSALAARDMGGSLQVLSDGLGTGASFILSLPLNGKMNT